MDLLVDTPYALLYIKYIKQTPQLNQMSNSFFVYIINQPLQNNKFVCKVGLSKNVKQRLETLQGANSSPLSIYASFLVADNRNDALKVERKIQKLLSDFNIKREWFAFNPVDLVNNIIPEIEHIISGLNVKVSIPTKAIADTKWTLAMYKEIKKQQAVLLGRKQRGQLTVEDEYKLEVMTRELKKEENLERKNGKKALKAETARRKAYEAKRLLKIGVFM